ncbi:MAG: hypothetical protein E6K91_01660 [Thaumarchaeota archaeon]|nr:MAG: hypothetical protein E6K91_01660 [Nitrososphaerota archaeon]
MDIRLYQIIGSLVPMEQELEEGKDLTKVKDLTPEAIKLGFEFAAAIKHGDGTRALDILAQIERLLTI